MATHNLVAGYQHFAWTNWLFLNWSQMSINLHCHNTRGSSVNKHDFVVWIVLISWVPSNSVFWNLDIFVPSVVNSDKVCSHFNSFKNVILNCCTCFHHQLSRRKSYYLLGSIWNGHFSNRVVYSSTLSSETCWLISLYDLSQLCEPHILYMCE